MKIVKARSPFIVTIPGQGGTHVSSRVILTVWNSGGTEPTIGQNGYYELSKVVPSSTQKDTFFNVSNYITEFIDNIKPSYPIFVGNDEDTTDTCIFRVVLQWFNGTAYATLSNTLYYGVNGFTNYLDGQQIPIEEKLNLLNNTSISNYYYKEDSYTSSATQYLNLFVDKTGAESLSVKYERIDGVVFSVTDNLLVSVAGVFNLKIPITLAKLDNEFINGCKVTITLVPTSGSNIVKTFFTYPVEECKYMPVLCDFKNRFGGWQTLTLFKAQTNNISVSGTNYKLMPSNVNYNVSRGTSKTFNLNGVQNIKLNTGFVDENYSEVMTDLLLSEVVLLDGKSVKVKTQNLELKNVLKDKLINYELDFEFNFDLINSVV